MSGDLPIGVAHFSCVDLPPLEFVCCADKAGFAAVGLRLHPAFPGAPFYTLRPGSLQMRDVKSALSDTGLRVYDIEFVVIDKDFRPSVLIPVFESAADLGAERLSVCGDDPDNHRFADNLSELAALSGSMGLGIDLEVMPWRHICSLERAVSAVDAVQSDNVGVLIDALHLSRSGGRPADLLAIPPDLIRSVQLCDASARRPCDNDGLIAEARGGRLPPGKGALPLLELVGAIPSTAALSVEVPNAGQAQQDHLNDLYASTAALLGLPSRALQRVSG